MKILGLDSSGLVASAAVVEEDVTIAEYTVNYKKTHSQTLIPMLDEIKRMTELDLHTLDAIAIASGPGSFTGLRIGSATAKGWDSHWIFRSSQYRQWMRSPIISMDAAPWSAPSWMRAEIRSIQGCMNFKNEKGQERDMSFAPC